MLVVLLVLIILGNHSELNSSLGRKQTNETIEKHNDKI